MSSRLNKQHKQLQCHAEQIQQDNQKQQKQQDEVCCTWIKLLPIDGKKFIVQQQTGVKAYEMALKKKKK